MTMSRRILLRNTSGKICKENYNIQLMFKKFYFRKSRRLSDNLEKYSRASCGLGSSVGIATDYGLGGPGSSPGGDEIFRPSRPALGLTQPPVKWVPGLSRGKERPGRDADRRHSVLRCVSITQRSTECTSVAGHSSQHNITKHSMLPQHPLWYNEINM